MFGLITSLACDEFSYSDARSSCKVYKVKKNSELAEMKIPNFIIVGAPKCATTSLYYYLKQHPEVFMPEDQTWKEPHFFGRDQRIAPRRCIRDERKYLRLFADARGAKRVGEATTSYLHSRTAAEEIKAYNPNMRIIASVRNPVELIPSMHYQNLVAHHEDILDLEKALAADPDRILEKRIPKHALKPAYLVYSRIVQFADNLERYFQAFGRENVLVLFFDDIKQDLNALIRNTSVSDLCPAIR